MKRHPVVSTFVFAAMLAALLGGGLLTGRAQNATPAAGTTPSSSVGVTSQVLGSGQPDAAPGQALGMRRIAFAPNGLVPLHRHPGALVLYVESGELTYSVVEGTVRIQRAATAGTPGPTEQLGAGKETVLRAGDWLFEQGVVHSAHNATSGQTVVLVSSLIASDKPFTVFQQMATPTA